jgi:hypothetical protein
MELCAHIWRFKIRRYSLFRQKANGGMNLDGAVGRRRGAAAPAWSNVIFETWRV